MTRASGNGVKEALTSSQASDVWAGAVRRAICLISPCRHDAENSTVDVVDPCTDEPYNDYALPARPDLDAQLRRLQETRARLRDAIDQVRNGRSKREILHDSVAARLQARLDSMPVIEQAKGILMAQNGCGPDEAFELLRRASQRANIKVSVLAEHIVQQIASPQGNGNAEGVRLVDGGPS